jgi:hypothetical protein
VVGFAVVVVVRVVVAVRLAMRVVMVMVVGTLTGSAPRFSAAGLPGMTTTDGAGPDLDQVVLNDEL